MSISKRIIQFLWDSTAWISEAANPIILIGTPLITATQVFYSVSEHLHWNWWRAGLLAAMLEFIGIGIMHSWKDARHYNRHMPENQLKTTSYVAGVVGYLLITEALVIGLEIWPDNIGWLAQMALPCLSVAALYVWSLYSELVPYMRELSTHLHCRDSDDQMQRELDDEIRQAEHSAKLTAIRAKANPQPPTPTPAPTQPPTPSHQQPAPTQSPDANPQPPTPDLTPTQLSRCQDIANLAANNRLTSWKDLASFDSWSARSAQRYWKMAQENNFIHLNGDDSYHPTGGTTL